jgi:hypothetical protein
MAEDNDDERHGNSTPQEATGADGEQKNAEAKPSAESSAKHACVCCGPRLSCSERALLECLVRADTSSWRAPAFSSYAYLRSELERMAPLQEAEKKAAHGAERALDEALLAMTEAARARDRKRKRVPRIKMPHPWITLKRFYSGSDIEQTWRAIHRAQAAAYLLYPDTELIPQAEHVEAVVAELQGEPSLLKSVTTLLTKLAASVPAAAPAAAVTVVASPAALVPGAGTTLRGIYERAIDVSDNLQREARGLRNALLIASMTCFFVLVALGVAHAIDKEIVELCTSKSPKACPITGSAHPFDVFTVELAGMLGGLLSIVIPLSLGEQIKTPYRVFNQQLLLKMLVGAASALGGILLIESEVITTIKLDSTTAILGYAVFFGFAQQVATGAIDRRADALAKQTPIAKSV